MPAIKPLQTFGQLSNEWRARIIEKGRSIGLNLKQTRDSYNKGTLGNRIIKAKGQQQGISPDEIRGRQARNNAARNASYLAQRQKNGEQLTEEELKQLAIGKKYWYHNK